MKNQRVGVLMGGLSAEREVSLATGEAVAAALLARGYDITPIYVDRDIDQVLRQVAIDVAFLALHGSFGEDGCVQGLLELLDIPYTGSGVTESALAMDKLKSKELFRLHNVPTPPYYVLQADEVDALEELHGPFGFPAFVKPRRQGSSIGAGRADNLAGLQQRCEEALQFDDTAVIERFVQGVEVAVGILDGEALGAIEIVPSQPFYDYRAKYQQGQSRYHLPARLPATRYQNVLRIAERAVHALGVEGASRVDLLVTPGENEYVLEVNTLPGMTETSLLPKMAQAAGYNFGDLCEAILARASVRNRRGTRRPQCDSRLDEAATLVMASAEAVSTP
ncbi:MAG: D-alanine--D-alanine ligase [Myxococcales bacterium]|nr:D-alanine--D-alanine ligase [Myxococcales bacterium]